MTRSPHEHRPSSTNGTGHAPGPSRGDGTRNGHTRPQAFAATWEAGDEDSRAGRIVVAGDGALAARVAAAVGGDASIVVVPGALAALAEVAAETQRRRADVMAEARDCVVLAGATLTGMESTALATLEELGLHGRVLVVDPAIGDNGSRRSARVLRSDADASQWRRAVLALRDDEPASADGSESLASEPRATAEGGGAVALPSVSEVLSAASHGVTVAGPQDVRLDGDEGDAELVQAILDIGAEGGKRAPRIALQIAQRRSGIAGLGLVVHERGDVPSGHASAVVAFRGETYGHLHAPPASASARQRPALADRLQPWADWLARWIALDQQARRLRDMAMRDELTGVWNRRYFDRFLGRLLHRAGHDRRQVTLMVFDIDNFKRYNDAHGHAAGDEILSATAQLMQSVVRDHDVVARIGGDEFAVIFWDAERPREEGSTHPDDVANIAKRFQRAVCDLRFPVLARSDMDTLTISGGLAGFPWDGRTPAELLHHADLMALESKRKGKNALTFGLGALRCELPPS